MIMKYLKQKAKFAARALRTYQAISRLPKAKRELIEDILHENSSYEDLGKRLRHVFPVLNKTSNPSLLHKERESVEIPVWRLWLQGFEDAPPIVQACTKQARIYSHGLKIYDLDKKNIEDYVSIPGHIYDLADSGRMKPVNFSDYLRSALLSKHGGVWMDATVYLTSEIPLSWLQSSFFAFSTTPQELLGRSMIPFSSWFIVAHAHSPILSVLCELMNEYWKNPGYNTHHYYFHLLARLAIDNFASCKEEYKKMLLLSNVPPHFLQLNLFENWDPVRWDELLTASPVHKLTYYSEGFQPDKRGTFYQHIIRS